MNLFDKNWKMFTQAFGDRLGEVDIDEARKIACQKEVHTRYLLGPDLLAGGEKVESIYRQVVSETGYDPGISKYLGLLDGDPHLFRGILEINEIVEKLGYERYRKITTSDGLDTYFLALFGTGDGTRIKEYIDYYKPSYLTVCLPSWNHFVSSFWGVDWCEIWNMFNNDGRRRINIGCYKSHEQIVSHLGDENLLEVDHTVAAVMGGEDDSPMELYKSIEPKTIANMYSYLGFVLDEYNMVIDCWAALKHEPKVYKKPTERFGGNWIVTGSGPSLDTSLEDIRRLSISHKVVAAGSNFTTLIKAGIRVDYLVLLERGAMNYDDYKGITEDYDCSKVRLVASTTCTAGLQELFADCALYYRPALTPLSIFSSSLDEVLSFEGPQSINAGLAFVSALGAENVAMFGIDLGTKDNQNPRSRDATGVSPRSFSHKVEGNLGGEVWTERFLEDGRLVAESCIANHEHTSYFNFSDGVMISGATPSVMKDGLPYENRECMEGIEKWWSELERYNQTMFAANWRAARPRIEVSRFIDGVRELVASEDFMTHSFYHTLTRLLSLDVPKYAQFPRRITRSFWARFIMAARRQSIVLSDASDDIQKGFKQELQAYCLSMCDEFELELYELCDYLETL